MASQLSLFEKALLFTLEHEGGYVKHPADPGGETNFGITRKTYPNLDIKKLTLEDAKAIYKRDFWDPYPYEKFPYEPLALKTFDMSVNMGSKTAHKQLQLCICSLGKYIKIDGILGPLSLQAIIDLDGEKLLKTYIDALERYYQNLAARFPSRMAFLKGWLKRVRA